LVEAGKGYACGGRVGKEATKRAAARVSRLRGGKFVIMISYPLDWQYI